MLSTKRNVGVEGLWFDECGGTVVCCRHENVWLVWKQHRIAFVRSIMLFWIMIGDDHFHFTWLVLVQP